MNLSRIGFKRSWAKHCVYCGVELCHDHRQQSEPACERESTWDHVEPGLKGRGIVGRHKVVACWLCNNKRGSRSIPQFLGMETKPQRTRKNPPGPVVWSQERQCYVYER